MGEELGHESSRRGPAVPAAVFGALGAWGLFGVGYELGMQTDLRIVAITAWCAVWATAIGIDRRANRDAPGFWVSDRPDSQSKP